MKPLTSVNAGSLDITKTGAPYEARLPFPCKWCQKPVEPGDEVADFKGVSMHRMCSLEAKLDDLTSTVEEQGKKIKELFHLTGV